MTARSRMLLGALAAALLGLLAAVPASADQAYDRVATAYAQNDGQLAPCGFTTAQLEAALRGTPPVFRTTIPELQRAIQSAIAAHKRGACKGVKPTEGMTGGAAPGAVPPMTTTPATTTPAPATTTPTATAPVAPATTTPAPATTVPVQQAAASNGGGSDRTALVIALIALGALLLAALALWGTARTRGWDPAWVARMRHAWGEAGFRTTSTWAEFTDWLRLGR